MSVFNGYYHDEAMSPTVYAWIRALEIESGDRLIQLAQKDAEIARLRHVAENAESFCTWLCEDSKKYPGTDAGDAARRLRQDLRKALSASKGDEA